MCKDAIREPQVKENREGARRGGEPGGNIQTTLWPKEGSTGEGHGPVLSPQSSFVSPRSRSASILAACRPCLGSPMKRLGLN